MELPDLNAALIETYRNLDHTTWAAKEMARHIKTTQQQAKWATELWQAAELKRASLEQQQQQPPLSLPAPANDASPAPFPNLSASAIILDTHNGDTTHPMVATVDANTMTDAVQTHEASAPADRQPHVVMEKSAQTDTIPHPQTTQAAT